ncbi:MAG: hypothetical protein WC876_02040 [Candidatus Thermoplasmatota archaeon]|jgi:hypothetical protein
MNYEFMPALKAVGLIAGLVFFLAAGVVIARGAWQARHPKLEAAIHAALKRARGHDS